MAFPTGDQYELVLNEGGREVRATITQVGASIRELTVDGQHVTEPYAASEPTPRGVGMVMVPWPNRTAGGRYTWRGTDQQLDLTEVKFGNASHGLLRFTAYRVVEQDAASVTLAADVVPQHGWPFHLATQVRYALVADGLEVAHTITNVGTEDAPCAVGTHPYLRVGDADPESLTLTVPADTYYTVDAALIPTAELPVEGTAEDLRAGQRIADGELNSAYGQVTHADGVATSILAAPDGRRTELWQDDSFGYVQVFTPTDHPRIEGTPGRAIAVEPMTAPPNALASGQSLRTLAPGETWVARWGIRSVTSA